MTLKKFQCAVSRPEWVKNIINELVPYSPVKTVFYSPNVKRVIQQGKTYDKYWSKNYCQTNRNLLLSNTRIAFEETYSVGFPSLRKPTPKIQAPKILYNISKRK